MPSSALIEGGPVNCVTDQVQRVEGGVGTTHDPLSPRRSFYGACRFSQSSPATPRSTARSLPHHRAVFLDPRCRPSSNMLDTIRKPPRGGEAERENTCHRQEGSRTSFQECRVDHAVRFYMPQLNDMNSWTDRTGHTRLRSFVDEDGHFWLEQNSQKRSKWATLARKGHSIAWEFDSPGGTYTGRMLIDGVIYTPAEATKKFFGTDRT